MTRLTLHDYWRSSAAYRVRIALNLKGVEYHSVSHNLLKGEQTGEAYRAINPLGLVPALDVGDQRLTQSMAIIEWLEVTYPEPPLLPDDTFTRAHVRSFAQTIACDIHPLNNLRVLKALDDGQSDPTDRRRMWTAHWMNAAFPALEAVLQRTAGAFAFGNCPNVADCFLVPQLYSARRFEVSLASFPTLARVAEHANAHPAFQKAHPDNQVRP